MSIVLQGSTSGSVTLQEPAIAGTTVLDLPATSGTVALTSNIPSTSAIYFYGSVNQSAPTFNNGAAIQYPANQVSSGVTIQNTSSRIRLDTAGIYLVVATLGRYDSSGASSPAGYIRKNGTIVSGQMHPVAGAWTQSSSNCVISCVVNDYIEVTVDRDNCVLWESTMLSIARVGT